MEERRRNEDTRIDVLTERVENWMESTTEYRKSLCAKLDVINSRLNELPCKAAGEERMSIRRDIGWLQKIVFTILAFGIPSLLGLAVAWGSLNTTVMRNTAKWDALDAKEVRLERAKQSEMPASLRMPQLPPR